MNFLTNGKTNWKYIIIVALVAVVATGGIWWYVQESTNNDRQVLNPQVPQKTVQVKSSESQSPNIAGISGLTRVSFGKMSTWTINANSPQNQSLTYLAVFGDGTKSNGGIYAQTPTFSHTYASPGNYIATFYVRDTLGNTTSESENITVAVPSQTSGAPNQCPTGQSWVCMGGNYCDMACPASNPNCCPLTPQTCGCMSVGNQGTMMLAPPAILGTVTAVNGNMITVSGKITVSQGYPNGSATTSIFTVNAANAQIQQNTAASTIASIAVGDTVLVQGILNGTTMAATFIRDTPANSY